MSDLSRESVERFVEKTLMKNVKLTPSGKERLSLEPLPEMPVFPLLNCRVGDKVKIMNGKNAGEIAVVEKAEWSDNNAYWDGNQPIPPNEYCIILKKVGEELYAAYLQEEAEKTYVQKESK